VVELCIAEKCVFSAFLVGIGNFAGSLRRGSRFRREIGYRLQAGVGWILEPGVDLGLLLNYYSQSFVLIQLILDKHRCLFPAAGDLFFGFLPYCLF